MLRSILILTFLAFSFAAELYAKSEFFDEEPAEPELIDSSELEEFYIDEEETHLILSLLEEENALRKIRSAGGISIPDTEYAQGMIRKFTARYMTSTGSKYLYKNLDEGERYRLFIRQEIKKRNLPAILEYLPMVESDYKISAKSRSGALGLWQFMENSMEPFLKKSEWIDERLDPWLSTKAALSKLQDNYRTFGDWPIAIAAYNCGAGAMRRILKEAEEKSFWYIAEKGLLRDESINYVPKLIALAAMAEHPERYDIFFPEADEGIRFNEFDFVTVNGSVELGWLSNELRLDLEILKALNNSLIKERTPPQQSYEIRLPEGLGESAWMALLKTGRIGEE